MKMDGPAQIYVRRKQKRTSTFPCLKVHGTRPFRNSESIPEYAIPPQSPRPVLNEGRRLRTSCRSECTHELCRAVSYDSRLAADPASDLTVEDEGWTASQAASAASIPLFMALCVPLILATFTKPAEHPSKAPPGKFSFGTDCSPPSFSTRAPYDSLSPLERRARK
jgi:hypothetical protein